MAMWDYGASWVAMVWDVVTMTKLPMVIRTMVHCDMGWRTIVYRGME